MLTIADHLPIMANPVGTANQDVVAKYTAELQQKWDAQPPVTKQHWWSKLWGNFTALHQATIFMLHAIDVVILDLDTLAMATEDKKATALDVMSCIYLVAVVPALPVYLTPFAGIIQAVVISVIFSNLIDWLCAKYHSAVWATQTLPPTPVKTV